MITVTLDRYYRTLLKKLTLQRVLVSFLLFLFVFAKTILFINKCPEIRSENKEIKPAYMLHGDRVDSGYLKHVTAVLERLGFQRIDNSTDFNLLWSHIYPFGETAPFSKNFLRNLKPHQKVNHFPGSGYFTNKVDLAVTALEHVPRAFQLPSQKFELLEYSKNHPDHLFVQKSNSHRGIKIVQLKDMNLNLSGTFVQQYIQSPFLIDGYKFDIGIYTVLTSVDPLRVYIYNGDVLLRFCAKKYEPFDPEDVDKYVVGDDYTPIWEVPSLKKLHNHQRLGMKETLNTYIRKTGKNPTKIWTEMENSIVTVFLEKEEKIIGITKRYKNVNNFFELVRFDFILDSNLNVYLMEANMSPNLSSDHFPPNKLLYENVLFGLFSLVGIAKYTKSLTPKSTDEEAMEVPEKSLMVFGEECSDPLCDACGALHCALCKHCLTLQNVRVLKQSYLEYLNKMNYKRIFPAKMNPKVKLEDVNLEKYSPENRFMILWFLGKCKQDKSWC